MAKVNNLVIKKSVGTSEHFATWDFTETTKSETIVSGSINNGDWVKIKSSAKQYYNGVEIPQWVKDDTWKIMELYGVRAVLGRNKSGTHNIVSAIHVSNLIGTKTSSTVTTSSVKALDHYEYEWQYDTGDGVWFDGGTGTTKNKNCKYSPPEGTIRFRVYVKPISKTHKVNGKDTSYWSGSWASAYYNMDIEPPATPGVPNVKMEKFKLTASLENISDMRTDYIEFEILNGSDVFKTAKVEVLRSMASYACTVSPGGEYRVRARALNKYKKSFFKSQWSNYSGSVSTIPSGVKEITVCRADSSTSVYLEWTPVSSAKTYNIQHTLKITNFDTSSEVTSVNGATLPKYTVTGLESGREIFFRVQAVNDQGSSSWSPIVSCIIGKKPAPPTTWSSTTTAVVGEPLTLYWLHNSQDNSKMKFSDIEMWVDGMKESHTVKGTDTSEEAEKTYSFPIDTYKYKEGVKIEWRVRTAGITGEYSDFSVKRTIDIYAQPTVDFKMTNINDDQITTVTEYPIKMKAIPGPKTQSPITYYISITSNEAYYTTDYIGKNKYIDKGQIIFEKNYDLDVSLETILSASDVDLETGISYTAHCIVGMNSGLTAESNFTFNVSWTESHVNPDCEISIDEENLIAFIKPYCINESNELIPNILLSVYRRESDGEFQPIIQNVENEMNTVITDPHPSLDYARYRIVATDTKTGAISWYDAPGYPVNIPIICIQWDEEWSNYIDNLNGVSIDKNYSGSMIKLRYNIEVNDNDSVECNVVRYAGRKYGVSYYSEQVVSQPSYSTAIPKTDKETIYALRRLSKYPGNCYIREPSGTGFWAKLDVSFGQSYSETTIPITISVERVEGGM